MFEGFAGVWTPVEFADQLGSKPRAVRVADEEVVLFRGAGGRVGALIDRCPHRGVALSLGRVGADGCLECPFHGWQFDQEGACRKVPLNDLPEAKRERLAATALPVRELGGLIWLFTDPRAAAAGEPDVPESLLDPRFCRYGHAQDWKTHWTRAMENMLDFPHLPFVHRRSIGRDMARQMGPSSVMHIETTETRAGMRIRASIDDKDKDSGYVEWRRPNGMVLSLPIPGRTIKMHVFCVPIDAERTRMMMVNARDFGRYNPLLRLLDLFNRRILLEDREVVESSRPAEVPEAQDEVSVGTDRATLAFRRYYLRELKGSRADARRSDVVPVAALSRRKDGEASAA